jgi:predicted TIM-barrel fold metal-dependent hydrolase
MEPPVSAVSYVLEPPDLWTARSVSGAPTWRSSGGEPAWMVGNYPCSIAAWQLDAVLPPGGPGGVEPVDLATLPDAVFTPEGRLAAQDEAGLGAEVLYPSPRLWGATGLVLDADVEAACVAAYNDWLAEFVRASPDRLVGVAAIPCHGGAEAAAAELRRAAALGLRGAVLRAFPTSQERSIHADDDTLWAAFADLGLVLSFDASFGPSTGTQVTGPRGVSTATALTSFVYEGVVERFPTLRIVLASTTAGWVPHWLEQADDLYMRRPSTHNPDLTRRLPSDYLRCRPFFTFSGNDVLLRYPDDYISATHLMWSSQYPTYHALETAEARSSVAALSADIADRILATTCRGLYGLPGGAEIDLEPDLAPLVHAIPA